MPVLYSIHILGQPLKKKEAEGAGFRRTIGGERFILSSAHQIKSAVLSAVGEAAGEASGIKSCDIFISDQT